MATYPTAAFEYEAMLGYGRNPPGLQVATLTLGPFSERLTRAQLITMDRFEPMPGVFLWAPPDDPGAWLRMVIEKWARLLMGKAVAHAFPCHDEPAFA